LVFSCHDAIFLPDEVNVNDVKLKELNEDVVVSSSWPAATIRISGFPR